MKRGLTTPAVFSYGLSDHRDLLTVHLGDILPIDRFIHIIAVMQEVAHT
jgi:hypothetical protein